MAGGVLRGCHPVPRDRLLVRMTFPIHSQFVDKRQGPCFTNTVDSAPPQAHGRPQVRSLIEASPAARGFRIRLVASLLCPVRSRKLEPRGYQGLEMSVMKGTSSRSPDPFIDEDIGARRCDVTGQGPSVRQRLSGATSGLPTSRLPPLPHPRWPRCDSHLPLPGAAPESDSGRAKPGLASGSRGLCSCHL